MHVVGGNSHASHVPRAKCWPATLTIDYQFNVGSAITTETDRAIVVVIIAAGECAGSRPPGGDYVIPLSLRYRPECLYDWLLLIGLGDNAAIMLLLAFDLWTA